MNLATVIQKIKPDEVGPDVEYECPKCHDTGWINWIDDSGHEFAKECECQITKRTLARIERSGLKRQIDRCTFENYNADADWQQRIKQTALKYINAYQQGNWFFIGGQSGCGKTHICTAIVAKIIRDGHSAKYMLWREDSTRLKGMVNSEEYRTELENFEKPYCLYIDDFFKGGHTEADIKLAFELIDARYRADLPTVISSEYQTQELAEIDEAIAGRIGERSMILNIAKKPERNYRVSEK